MEYVAAGVVVLIVVLVGFADHRGSPHCRWCGGRHFGRCMYNPRSGPVLSNANDGHFDYYDPNK